MGFIPYTPYRECLIQRSNLDVTEHALQEIESQCLLPGGHEFADFAEQGCRYLVDARQSDWRSAGLLYYYGFLNLAKVLLINANP